MQGSTGPEKTRARKACEPCRRKKTKCPGEHPACSFCQRLNQRCTYETRQGSEARISKEHNNKITGRTDSQGRILQLESHVEQLYDLLNNINHAVPTATKSRTTAADGQPNQQGSSPVTSMASETNTQSISSSDILWNKYTNLDNYTLNGLVDAYGRQVHCQPLPLFNPTTLATDMPSWPDYLSLTFVAVASRFWNENLVSQAGGNLDASIHRARRRIMNEVADGSRALRLVQALCLLIQLNISNGDRLAAWLNIGIGARIVVFVANSAPGDEREHWSRCYWSLYILDRMYGASFSTMQAFPDDVGPPKHSPHYTIPFEPDAWAVRERENDDASQTGNEVPLRLGVCCIRLISIWGYAIAFARNVKGKERSIIWSEDPSYHKVVAELYQFEISMGQAHRLRQVRYHEQSAATLESNRSYWAPWLTMQCVYHTIQIMIHHPFFHIAKLHSDEVHQAPSFLQRTVDQMLLHSGWVVKLLRLCGEKQFKVSDPFVAHLASITATGYLFFFNAKDDDLVLQAQQSFDVCHAFVERCSETWSHLKHTVHKLNILRQSTGSRLPAHPRGTASSAQASILWSLFDYSSSTTVPGPNEPASSIVELNVTTQFLSPLESMDLPVPASRQGRDRVRTADADQSVFGPPMNTSIAFEDSVNIFDTTLMADFHATNLTTDFWTAFGQL